MIYSRNALDMEYIYTLVTIIFLLVLALFYLGKRYRERGNKIIYLLNAVENNDFAFKFTELKGSRTNRLFNKALNRIKELIATEKKRIKTQDDYYGQILENIVTGIITINQNGDVMMSNSRARMLLGMPVITSLCQMSRVTKTLPDTVEGLQPGDSCSVSLSNEWGEMNLVLKASICGNLKVVTIDDIGNELDIKETESWLKLTRVMTHEIMNLATPIVSISDTLLHLCSNNDKIITEALETINTTSKGLITFVETYRKFTAIPLPVIGVVNLGDFLNRISSMFRYELTSNNIELKIDTAKHNILGISFHADEKLFTQVMVNLLKNAITAILQKKSMVQEGAVSIESYIIAVNLVSVKPELIIEISNNGVPISNEIKDQIFVPFFTTNTNGTGIGLSISRQIMRLHNGSLKLKNDNPAITTFQIKL